MKCKHVSLSKIEKAAHNNFRILRSSQAFLLRLSLSIGSFLIFCFFFSRLNTVSAQIDLDLLLNTPTPSPLPPGQEYILEIEQLDISTGSDSGQLGSFSKSERSRFEENGYVVRSSDHPISFSVDRTQIAFSSFETASAQEEKSTATVTSEGSGFQALMGATSAFSSVNGTVIPPTRCDSRRTCSPLRAQSWSDGQTPGWGYSLLGKNAPKDFRDGKFYRPVSLDGSISLLSHGELTKKDTFTLNWKVITDTLTAETYSSVVTLFIIPY